MLSKKYAGNNVRMELKIDEKPKTLPQLGYFFGVVLPYYMYGLIRAGNDLEIGNRTDEEMVENSLKERHLKNGPVWNSTSIKEIQAPSMAGQLVVLKINKRSHIEKDGPLVLFKSLDKHIQWLSLIHISEPTRPY